MCSNRCSGLEGQESDRSLLCLGQHEYSLVHAFPARYESSPNFRWLQSARTTCQDEKRHAAPLTSFTVFASLLVLDSHSFAGRGHRSSLFTATGSLAHLFFSSCCASFGRSTSLCRIRKLAQLTIAAHPVHQLARKASCCHFHGSR